MLKFRFGYVSYLFFSLNTVFCEIKLIVRPSKTVLEGSRLNISCQFDERRYAIQWRMNGKEIAEGCIIYPGSNQMIKCKETENSYTLIFDSVKFDVSGNWTCIHSNDESNTEVHVVVPELVQFSQIEILPTAVAASSRLEWSGHAVSGSSGWPDTGTGTRSSPIDLRPNGNALLLECTSRCSSNAAPLKWTIRNTTYSSEYPSSATNLPENSEEEKCPKGLFAAKSQALLTCAISSNVEISTLLLHPESSFSLSHNEIQLVGLNQIMCQPNRKEKHGVLARSKAVTDYDCLGNGKGHSVCVYVICKGLPAPLFTLGEQIALGISCLLAVVMATIMCPLTWQRWRRTEKNMHNGHLHQQGEVELML